MARAIPLIHPNRINSLVIKEIGNKGSFNRRNVHTLEYKWIYFTQCERLYVKKLHPESVFSPFKQLLVTESLSAKTGI